MNIPQGSEFETESAQAALGAQPPLPNVSSDSDVNILIVGEYSEGEGATSNKDVGPSAKSMLRSFRFHRARSIALGQEKLFIRVHHHQFTWDLTKEPQVDLNAFKSLKARGAGNSLLLRKLKEHYAYKLEKVLSDGTAVAAKKLTARSVARAYMHDDVGIHQRKEASVNEYCDTPVHQSEDIAEQYDASEDIELKRVVNEQCALEFADLPRQLDAKIFECKNLEEKNTSLEIMNWTSKYKKEAARYTEETNHLRQKLVNAEERMKSLEENNNEWEVWHQALKKALASEGMGDMGDPTFEELFEHNKKFFTIAKQGTKGDYQEDLVSTAVTLENVGFARREKIAKKKKIQELLFQPWTKYLVDVRGVEISDNNSGFRVTVAIQHQSQHRFSDVIKLLKTFLCKDPAFWKSIFSQILGIQFTPDSENA
ncbi:hypothetical protein GIB67_005032 [Kingdonia uniflora]|uniref:Uncharacterized protein n=1 Tax=Kingdonia uniflora TaxID=39325 RepID=A0A7J7NN79_9MAGN|nr:hypothetical protein GIB67_005032 [Kingdonia uniflora]